MTLILKKIRRKEVLPELVPMGRTTMDQNTVWTLYFSLSLSLQECPEEDTVCQTYLGDPLSIQAEPHRLIASVSAA